MNCDFAKIESEARDAINILPPLTTQPITEVKMAKESLPNSLFTTQLIYPANGRFRNLLGQTFGRLLVIQFCGTRSSRGIWLCACSCGEVILANSNALNTGSRRSCGCLVKDTAQSLMIRHGETVNGRWTPEYRSYHEAKARCNNPRRKGYENYGGRGIKFLFSSFGEFVAEIGRKPSLEYSLDRYPDNNGHYQPGNVRWATRQEQANNRRPRRKV